MLDYSHNILKLNFIIMELLNSHNYVLHTVPCVAIYTPVLGRNGFEHFLSLNLCLANYNNSMVSMIQ